MMVYVGIDVGRTGALAYIVDGRPNQAGVVDLGDSPVSQAMKIAAKCHELRENAEILVGLERVTSRPKQGVASTFTFGTFYGAVLGALAVLGVPFELLRPQDWRRGVFGALRGARDKKELSRE
ncbi:MAG: hypothetical protein Q9M13_07310, partial [Mariprofundales bacterium]|nr:hypothetical protein [Mariprofundales bacterium]